MSWINAGTLNPIHSGYIMWLLFIFINEYDTHHFNNTHPKNTIDCDGLQQLSCQDDYKIDYMFKMNLNPSHLTGTARILQSLSYLLCSFHICEYQWVSARNIYEVQGASHVRTFGLNLQGHLTGLGICHILSVTPTVWRDILFSHLVKVISRRCHE